MPKDLFARVEKASNRLGSHMTEVCRAGIRGYLDGLETQWKRDDEEKEERKRKRRGALLPRGWNKPKGFDGTPGQTVEEAEATAEMEVLWKKMTVFVDAGVDERDRASRAITAESFIVEVCDTAEQADMLSEKIRVYAEKGRR